MLTAIAIADATLSTVVAAVAIIKWKRAAKAERSWHWNALDLDDECRRLSAHITRLSGQVDAQRAKPGPQRRARERALIASKTAELVREIAA